MRIGPLYIDDASLAKLCNKLKIVSLEAFGSVLRDDFGPESDIDLLATFAAGHPASLSELIGAEAALSELFGRRVDLVPKANLKWALKDRVLREAQPVYAV